MKNIILKIIVILISSTSYGAGNFNLHRISAEDLKLQNIKISPFPAYNSSFEKSPVLAPAFDLTLKLPFKDIGDRLKGIEGIEILDKTKPILAKENDYITFSNIRINVNGIEAEPTFCIRPSFEGRNKISIKFVGIYFDIILGHKSFPIPVMDKNEVMNFVIEKVTDALLKNMNAAFSANKVPLKAEDMIAFNYDKFSWILRADISPKFIAPLMPGLLDNINLTDFSFDDEGFAMSVDSNASSIMELPGYNLAISDGLITNFIERYTKNSDFDLTPPGNDGGIKFRSDGGVELAGKAQIKSLPFRPNVYFTAEITPILTAPNTIRLRFEKINIRKLYGIALLGSVANLLQNQIISSAVDNITNNAELARVMSIKKINDKTLELKLENKAFLPSFARGVLIKDLLVKRGLMYLDFEF